MSSLGILFPLSTKREREGDWSTVQCEQALILMPRAGGFWEMPLAPFFFSHRGAEPKDAALSPWVSSSHTEAEAGSNTIIILSCEQHLLGVTPVNRPYKSFATLLFLSLSLGQGGWLNQEISTFSTEELQKRSPKVHLFYIFFFLL